MDEKMIISALEDLPLGSISFQQTVASTNDIAAAWALEEKEDFSLVIAETQTSGRGRSGRTWISVPGASLTFSLLLRPLSSDPESIVNKYTALGALAICQTLQKRYHLSPQIKWPNDVLLEGKKCCGILSEAIYRGEELEGIVLGVGINIQSHAVPHARELDFPAGYIEEFSSEPIDRLLLLKSILINILTLRDILHTEEFIRSWEQYLAYRGQQVEIISPAGELFQHGSVMGIDSLGRLKIQPDDGEIEFIEYGQIRLRPVIAR